MQENDAVNTASLKAQSQAEQLLANVRARKQSMISEEVDDDEGAVPLTTLASVSSKATLASRPSNVSSMRLMSSSSNMLRRQTSIAGMEEAGGGGDEGAHAEATFRYQRAQIRVLQEELTTLQETHKQVKAKYDATAEMMERMRVEHNTLASYVQQMHALLDKNKSLQSTHEAKQRMLETDISSARAHVATTRKNEKQLARAAKVTEVRLNEATEELTALKKELENERTNQGGLAVPRPEHERVVQEHQRLEKQKAELVVAFKHQIHLIDILKRQKIHLETAKMLSFIEDEFSQTLELGV
ncbi:Aste57867_16294 [Aphanomyces stellatus]|uniref:Aste57867_16294 protein n=1 Tax=Aphanomyces stellatus TaxID=120398 RepID=A0A485L704_9STRA|nr:hypothetical protein As57867_016237 [Aphanomyces stellatus]VFT93070.1 Aste57867_16294 [Aphanomyces stellatus]